MLKPVTEAELLDTVTRLREKLDEEWAQVYSVRNLTRTLQENLPFLKGNLLNELLQGQVWDEQTLRDKMDALSLPDLNGEPIQLMLVRLEEPFIHYDFRSLSLIEYAIANIAEELFHKKFHLWHTKDPHDYLIFVVAGLKPGALETDTQRFERTAVELQSVVRTYLKGHISIIVSQPGVFPGRCRRYMTNVCRLRAKGSATSKICCCVRPPNPKTWKSERFAACTSRLR